MSNSNSAQDGSGDTFVSFESTQGPALTGTLLRLSRYEVSFEIYSSQCVLRVSETLANFKIVLHSQPVYVGRATITNLVNVGTMAVCEVKLDEGWHDLQSFLPKLEGECLREGFRGFVQQWHSIYKIIPEYKSIVSDMQMFLTDLRLWLDQVELGIRSTPSGDRIKLERDLAMSLGESTTPAIGNLFERFEAVTEEVEKAQPELQAVHSVFAKRMLHPLLLCAPFLYRSFRKPLGYAGDYELVNMICRDPLEGSTFFAKIVNLWFLKQPPAEAHRNRIQYLVDRISETALAAARQNRRARIVSVGCGPAQEVQRFISEGTLAEHAEFTLIDFDQETAEYTRSMLERLKNQYGRGTPVQVVRKSVNQILKEAGRSIERSVQTQFDFVYCAGLFDYMSDSICRRLSTVLYEWVAPGGLFVSTNVDRSNPRRLTMNYIMDWHLIYRTGAQLKALRPDFINGAEENVLADLTGVNIHYSARKPACG